MFFYALQENASHECNNSLPERQNGQTSLQAIGMVHKRLFSRWDAARKARAPAINSKAVSHQ